MVGARQLGFNLQVNQNLVTNCLARPCWASTHRLTRTSSPTVSPAPVGLQPTGQPEPRHQPSRPPRSTFNSQGNQNPATNRLAGPPISISVGARQLGFNPQVTQNLATNCLARLGQPSTPRVTRTSSPTVSPRPELRHKNYHTRRGDFIFG
jgi:hypothetical protein